MNLNTATNEQLEEYRAKTASILRIDPFMLDYIWMVDPETGLKNRVLYAKRGAAEVLRKDLGINVLSMEHHESDGWLMFTAIGKDKTGRQEIAHGSAYVGDGVKGDKKAHSVMTASTRALRRLTLQFVAGGILDESEVQAQSALAAAPAASEATLAGSPAVLPPPQAAPSQAPGKDITTKVEYHAVLQNHVGMTAVAVCIDCKKPLSDHTLVNSERVCPSEADIQPAKTPATLEYSVAQNPPNQGVTAQEIAAKQSDIKADTEPPKKRQYRRKNQVNIASPGQTPSVPPATANEPEQGATGNRPNDTLLSPNPLEAAVEIGAAAVKFALAPTPPQVNIAAPPQVNSAPAPVLSKEKQDEYRNRLSKYYNDILPRGGMQSSENIGGPTMKTRRFAAIHTGVADTKQMTEQHWEDLFEFLDANASNPKFLVDYINKALGV